MKLLDMVDVREGDDVDYYSYRQARVLSDEWVPWTGEMSRLQEKLVANVNVARQDGLVVRPDNHVVYGVMGTHEDPVYLWFHDGRVYVGSTEHLVVGQT